MYQIMAWDAEGRAGDAGEIDCKDHNLNIKVVHGMVHIFKLMAWDMGHPKYAAMHIHEGDMAFDVDMIHVSIHAERGMNDCLYTYIGVVDRTAKSRMFCICGEKVNRKVENDFKKWLKAREACNPMPVFQLGIKYDQPAAMGYAMFIQGGECVGSK